MHDFLIVLLVVAAPFMGAYLIAMVGYGIHQLVGDERDALHGALTGRRNSAAYGATGAGDGGGSCAGGGGNCGGDGGGGAGGCGAG